MNLIMFRNMNLYKFLEINESKLRIFDLGQKFETEHIIML